MSATPDRLRPPPRERSGAPEVVIDLAEAIAALRAEDHASTDGHRQIGLASRGDLRLVLFAFESGGFLREHSAPGVVTIHCLEGHFRVGTPSGDAHLRPGEMLVLDPDLPHDVAAEDQAAMLLTVNLEKPRNHD